MARKSFLQMHNEVGGSYSSPERAYQVKNRQQTLAQKQQEVNQQVIANGQKKQAQKQAQPTGAVKDMNQLLTAAVDIKKKGYDPVFAQTNAAVQRTKQEKTSANTVLEQTIKDLQKQKKPGGMGTYQGTTDYNAGIQQQIDELQNQIDTSKQEAADLNIYLINALPVNDRQALEKYAEARNKDSGRSASVTSSGGVPIPWLENFFVKENADEYQALKEKYGEEMIDQLAETLIRQSNAREVQQMQETGAKAGDEHPVLGSIASIPTNVMAGATALLGRGAEVLTRTGQYPTLDPSNPYNIGTYGSAVQSQVASNIEGDGSNPLRKAGSYVYRGGMSAAESGLRALTGKAGTVLLSGLGSFEQNVAKASAQGASPEKAFTLGLTNAAIEALSEEIPLDNLLEAAKGGKQTFKQALGLALAQAGIEASTEEVSLIGTTLAEAAILKDKSEYSQYIQSRMAEGADYQTALNEVFQDLLQEAADTAIVSGISGAGMSGVSSIATNVAANKAAKKQGSGQANTQTDTDITTDTDTQQSPQQATETPLQGEPADPRHVAAQQEQAAQTQPVAQQDTAISENATPSNTITDTLLDPIGQEQAQPNQALENLSPYPTQDTAQPQQQVEIDPMLEGIQQPPVAERAPSQQELNSMPDDAFMDWMTDQSSARDPRNGISDPMADRDASEVGKRDVKAYQYENPEVKPFFAQEALQMSAELQDTIKAERTYNDDVYYESGGEKGYSGNSRLTSDSIAALRDDYGLSYDQIQKGLFDIINDQGSENNAAAKRIELVLNDRLLNGYKDFYTGKQVPPNQGYLDLLRSQQSASTVQSQQGPYDPGIKGTGAAESNFTAKPFYNALLSETNAQSDRASDVRPMELPETDVYGNNVSAVTGNVYGSDITSDEMASLMEEPTARGDFSYEEITNEQAKQMAAEKLRSAGNWDSALDTWTKSVANGSTGAEMAARGALLLKHFSDEGDSKNWVKTLKYMQKLSTNTAQGLQAFKIIRDANDIVVSMDPISTAETAVTRIQDMEQGDTTFNQKKYKGTFEDWKNEVSKNITDIAFEIDSVQDGDTASMQQIIRKIAKQRKTTAWLGFTNRLSASANASLNTLQFSDLKVVADTQLLRMTDDFRRRSVGEIANGLRKSAMLSSIKTFKRNLQGNTAVGLLDSFGDSTTGAIMDSLLSKVTGKRTTGNDFFRPVTYLKNAKNSGSFASLCVELNIPIETDAKSSYAAANGESGGGKYVGKTFRSTGNIVMRGLYAYQKYQSYALEVSDKIFEGGTKGAVDASLEKLNGLNADERQRLADFTANRRTFKDATWEGSDGRTHGSALSRTAQGLKSGIGNVAEQVGGATAKAVADTVTDAAVPFVQVPTNVAQTGVDYSTGVLKGAYEMISLVEDARKGIEIPVERQRQAVSDFGRGTTGLGLIALATVAASRGIIRVGDDDDKNVDALHQSEGRNGAQINWSAWKRDLTGESTEWKSSDIISSLDSVEPFNTHMYLGVELSQEDDFLSMTKAYPKATFESSFNAFMDSPMVTGLQEIGEDITELARSDDKAETMGEISAEAAGSYASSYIPQFVRQIAQYTDGYYRDTRGNNKLETAVNQVKTSVPGLSKTLPIKVNGLGEPQERPGFTQTFLDPTNTTKYQPNEITAYLDLLYEQTGDSSFYPEYQAPMSITVGGEKISLDGTQRVTYQTAYGNTYNGLTSELMKDATFNAMSPEIQGEIINRVRDIATQAGKASISENVDAPVDTAQGIIRNEVKSKFGKAYDTLVDSLDNGGDSAGGSQALDQAYSLYTTLSEDEQKAFRDENGGRVGYFLTAKEADISTEQFADLYSTYRTLDNNEDISAKEKAQQWSSTLAKAQKSGNLTKTQANTLKDSMVFRTASVAKSEKFDNLVESGMSTDTADKITHLLDGIQGTGKDGTVRPIDKYSAIAGSSLSASDKETALYEYMTDAMDEKYTYAKRNMGLTVDDFVEAYKVTDKYSLKEDQKKAWKAMGYTESEAENLWKLYKGKLT